METLYVVYQGAYTQDIDGATFLPKIIGIFKDYDNAIHTVNVFNNANVGRHYFIEQIATDII